jgi:hypothetical protein
MAKQNKMAGKNRTKKRIKGGMKRINAELKNNFEAILAMMRKPGARLTKISGSSLKVFIFKLDVPEVQGNAEFLGVNENGTAFTRPIYSLVFKFCVVSPPGMDTKLAPLTLSNGEAKDKEAEFLEGFADEAKMQQEIFLSTVTPIGKYICPAIVDFAYFTSADAAIFLNELKGLTPGAPASAPPPPVVARRTTPGLSLLRGRPVRRVGFQEPVRIDDATIMLDYLLANVTGRKQLGLITMELASSDYGELEDQRERAMHAEEGLSDIEHYGLTPEQVELSRMQIAVYNNSSAYTVALLLIEALKCKKFPWDCHTGNALAKSDGLKALLIDFGRTLAYYLASGGGDDKYYPYPIANEDGAIDEDIIRVYNVTSGGNYLTDIKAILALDVTSLFVSRTDPIDVVISRVNNILRFMSCIDYAINSTFFELDDQSPQMIDLLATMYGPDLSRDWYTPEIKPDWAALGSSEFFKERVARVLPIFLHLAAGSQAAQNLLSGRALESATNPPDGAARDFEPSLFSFRRDLKDYNRGSTFRKGGAKTRAKATSTFRATFRKSGAKSTANATFKKSGAKNSVIHR